MPQECSIIGKIPGYNKTIDPDGNFQNILLRDITYIDLLPATYNINSKIQNVLTDGIKAVDNESLYEYKSGGSDASKTAAIFTSVLKTMGIYLQKRFTAAFAGNRDAEGYSSIYGEELSAGIQAEAKKVIQDFTEAKSIRILAANDSTFTETISNTYTPKGTLENISQSFLNKGGNVLQNSAGLMQKAQSLSYERALDTLTNFSSNGSLMDIISGKLLGLQFASPNAWQESSYSSTLSLFIKLASPAGDPLSILKYITLPILTLMGAGSPLTVNGLTYGMPLIWDVRAYGITRFKVGALAALTISRGSYETVFNKDKQPLLVDVRLTIVPLVQDFAVQYSKDNDITNQSSIEYAKEYQVKANAIAEGLVKASSAPSVGTSILSSFTKLMNMLISTMQNIIPDGLGKSPQLYSEHVLGVQSPSDEIEGLMGLGVDIDSKRTINFTSIPKTHLYSI